MGCAGSAGGGLIEGWIVSLSYNSANRLTGITDVVGQTTNLYYENTGFPHLVTKVSDPLIDGGGQRRSALFDYRPGGFFLLANN